jgi:hypothetical protein
MVVERRGAGGEEERGANGRRHFIDVTRLAGAGICRLARWWYSYEGYCTPDGYLGMQ